MYLYTSSVADFIESINHKNLVSRLKDNFCDKFDHGVTESEITSWKNSLTALSLLLTEAGLYEAIIFLEFRMPLCSKRCDVILVGKDASGQSNAVVIELKQWNFVRLTEIPDSIFVVDHPVLHPSVQVRNYCQYLKYYHEAFTQFNLGIQGCSFLHNMEDNESLEILSNPSLFGINLSDYPIFHKKNSSDFILWLKVKIGNGQGSVVADRLIKGGVRPSTKLLDVVAQAIQDNFEWRLLDEQMVVFNTIVSKVELAKKSGKKSVIVIRGGPGTGKSVLAIQLLAYAAKNHWRIAHATGSKAFITVLQALTQSFADIYLRKIYNARYLNQIPVKHLFSTFANIGKLGSENTNRLDLVVGDEAHRLWDFRRNRYGGINRQLSNTPMVDEIINASKVSAFFLDDNQTVRTDEIGSVAYIKKHAEEKGLSVDIIDLNIQFRCSGSKAFTDWIDYVIEFSRKGSPIMNKFEDYDFQIVNSMYDMQEKLDYLRSKGNKCRFVAGFCWPWHPDKAGIHHDVQDPRFNGWSAPWGENTNTPTAQNVLTNPYFKWATDDSCYGQVGSIYSAQGFEFDYVGLIFGEDLKIRNGSWISDLNANKDRQFKKDIKRTGDNPTTKLRNIYRVLLTRGIKGTYVFFLDPETRKHFEKMRG